MEISQQFCFVLPRAGDVRPTLESWLEVIPDTDFRARWEGEELIIFTQTSGDPWAAGKFVRRYLDAFHPGRSFGFTYAWTCEPRLIDGYGGGVMLASAEGLANYGADTTRCYYQMKLAREKGLEPLT